MKQFDRNWICRFKAKIFKMERQFATVPRPLVEAEVLNHAETYTIEIYDEKENYLFNDRFEIIKGGDKYLIKTPSADFKIGNVYWFKVKK